MTGRCGRSTAGLVLALALVAVPLVTARAAQAATVACPPMSTDVCKNLEPVAECVWDNRDGTKTALWGWDNPTADTAAIAVGSKNRMSPGADDQGQPTSFGPGRHRNVFTTTFTGSSASWRLGSHDADVRGDTAACATKPVPQVGGMGAVLLFVLMLGLGSLLVLAARRRPRPVAV